MLGSIWIEFNRDIVQHGYYGVKLTIELVVVVMAAALQGSMIPLSEYIWKMRAKSEPQLENHQKKETKQTPRSISRGDQILTTFYMVSEQHTSVLISGCELPELFLELEASPARVTWGASVEGVEGYEERPPSPAPETTMLGGGIYGKQHRTKYQSIIPPFWPYKRFKLINKPWILNRNSYYKRECSSNLN